MRTHTQAFKDEIKQFGREFNDLLYYTANGSTLHYNNEHINSVNYSFNSSLLKSVMQTIEIDSDLDLEVGNTIDYRLSLVGVTGSELQFNNFTITKKEEQKDTHSYLYTCNDNMIKAMTDYVSLNVTYPITIRNYINAICTHLGITFKNASDIFTNYNQEITSEHYLDSDGHSLGYTFRDVLDDLAEATGGFICIDNNGALEIRYPINTNDTINEEYFQDNNVNIGKKYGPINVVTLSRNGVDNLVRPSTLPTTITEIKIENNPILDQTNREDFIDGIYNQLNGLEFYLNDFQTLGILYYEVGDLYNVSIDNTTYKCLMLNDNIIRDSGLTENIYTDEPTTSVTDYKYASDTDKLEKTSRNAYFLADKANGVAEMIVEGIGSNGQVTGASVIASINDDESNLTLNADKINLNGAVTANNNFIINQDGSVTMNNGNISLYDDGEDSQHPVIMITEGGTTEWTSAFYSSGMDFNSSNEWVGLTGPNLYLAHKNNNTVTRWTSITPGYDDDSAIKCGYGNTTNFEITNHQSGSYLIINGGANISGDVTISNGMYKIGTTDLIEEGSNSNGNYIKYANGTMICWTKQTITTAITTAWGVLYESSGIDLGTMPATFISTPSITATINSQRAAFIESVYNSSTTSWGRTYLVRPMSTSSNSYDITLMAIGKWK